MSAPARRVVDVYDGAGWRTLPGGEAGLAGLAPGDVIRMFESDGTPVVADDGAIRWRVVSIGAPDAVTGDLDVELETLPPSAVELACVVDGSWFPQGMRATDLGPPRRLRP